MKHYVAYTRVSTVKQGTKGVSLQEQKSAIEQHALRHNLTISEWFEETVTAAKTGRALFTNIIKRLKKGESDGLIIHKIDRSARNLKDWAMLGELIDSGVDVQIAAESYDLSSRGGRLSADIQAVVAADYIRNLREETYKGIRGRLKQGLYPMKAPVGYVDNGQGQVKTLDPIKAPLVKKAFQLYASGNYSIRSLAEEMHEMGLRSHRDGKLGKNGLSKILGNPFYYGLMRVKTTGETYPGIHEPLISKALFTQVQKILAGKYRVKVNIHAYAFRRTFKCQDCGYSLIGEKQKGHIYYRCHTTGCPMTSIREEALIAEIQKALSTIKITPELLTGLRLQLEQEKAYNQEQQEALKKSFELQLSQAQSRLERLMDIFIDGTIEEETFNRKQQTLQAEVATLEDKIKDVNGYIGHIHESIEEFLELAEAFILGQKTASKPYERDTVKIFTSNPTVSPTSVELPIDLPWSLFVGVPSGTYGCGKRDTPRTKKKADYSKLMEALKEVFTEKEDNNTL